MADPTNETCHYCGDSYPAPVSLHHTEDECRAVPVLLPTVTPAEVAAAVDLTRAIDTLSWEEIEQMSRTRVAEDPMADPTLIAADIEAAHRILSVPRSRSEASVRRVAAVIATARRDADAAGYARGQAHLQDEIAALRLALANRDAPSDADTMTHRYLERMLPPVPLTPPPTPEPTPSRRALPEQREWVAPDGLPDGFRLEASAMCGGKGPDHCRKGSSCRKHNACVYGGGS